MTSSSASQSLLAEHMTDSNNPSAAPPNNIQKKSAVGFVVWPQPGHFFPTLALAKKLRKEGYEIIYFSSPQGARLVRNQGFECAVICTEPELITAMPDEQRAAHMEALVENFSPKFKAYGIEHLYVDPILFFAAFGGLRCGIDTQFLWTLDPPVVGNGHLPYGLSLRQHRSWRSRVAPSLFWKTPLARSEEELTRDQQKGESKMHELLLRYASEFRLDVIYSSFGYLPVLPGVVFAPSAIFRSRDKSLSYLGLSIDLTRKEPDLDFNFTDRSVYCTFGTNFMFYPEAEAVLAQVIAAAAQSTGTSFLIQVPNGYISKQSIPANVQLVHSVPTLKVLQKVSAAIIHGGLGGIKECIYFQVPVLVIPFFFDQPANAAMAERNGIGIAIAPKEATAEAIQNCLHKLLHRPNYRAALAALRTRCLAENQEDIPFQHHEKTRSA